MPKKWKVFSKSKGKGTSHESSSSSGSDDESSSGSSYVSSSSDSSKSSASAQSVDSSGAKIVKPIKLATIPNFDDSSDDSSEDFGCGTYRRREDLSQSSSSGRSSSSISSSYSSRSTSGSDEDSDDDSRSSKSSASSSSSEEEVKEMPSRATSSRAPARRTMDNRKSISEPVLKNINFDDDLKPGKIKAKSSFGLFKSRFLGKQKKSKGKEGGSNEDDKKSKSSLLKSKISSSKKQESSSDSESSEDDGSSSYSSSSVESDESSIPSSKGSKGKQTTNSSSEDEKEVSKPNRRASVSAAPTTTSADTPRKPRRATVDSEATNKPRRPSPPSLAPSLYDEQQAAMVNRRKSITKDSNDKDAAKEAPKTTAKANWGKLAKAVKKEEPSADVEDVFLQMLKKAKQMKEEKQKAVGSDANLGEKSKSLAEEATEYKSKSVEKSKYDESSDSDSDEYGAKSEKNEGRRQRADSSSSSGSSSSSEMSDAASLQTESSNEDDEIEETKTMSSDEEGEDMLSAESQMSILTPIAEESVMCTDVEPGSDDSEVVSLSSESSKSSSSGGSISEFDLDDSGKSSGDDQSEQEEDVQQTSQNNAIEVEAVGGEAMLTDMPDESYVDLAKRKAVQNVMKDKGLSAVERNKKIQDIMAGRVKLPKISKKKNDDDPVASFGATKAPPDANEPPVAKEPPVATPEIQPNNAAEAEHTGAEAMLTDMPDENDTALAKRKAVQNIMKDASLSAVERNKKIQDIMAGRVELPKVSAQPSQDPLDTTIEAVSEPANHEVQHRKSRRRKKSTKKAAMLNGVAKTEPTTVSVNHELKGSFTKQNQASQSTMDTVDSSGDEQRDAELINVPCHQNLTEKSSPLLEIDKHVSAKNSKKYKTMFQKALSSAESSDNKTPEQKAMLLSMTCALHDLDSQWNLDTYSTSSQSHSSTSKPMQCTLGERERISPWRKHLGSDGQIEMSDTWNSLLNGMKMQAVKPGSQKPRQEQSPTNSGLSDSYRSTIGDSYRSFETSLNGSYRSNNRNCNGSYASTGSCVSLNESYRSMCESIDRNVLRRPRMPSVRLTKASFEPHRESLVLQKINQNMLLEPFSEDDGEDSEDDTDVNDKRSAQNKVTRAQLWFNSWKKLDPRWQIRDFFDEVSVLFDDAEIFTVWRPTSFDAIAKMMKGEGVGKGLEIKGKSAQCGDLSGYVPFLQIHEECHKSQVRLHKTDRTKVFFKSRKARNAVGKHLGTKAKEMALRVTKAKFAMARIDEKGGDEEVLTKEITDYDVETSEITINDDYAPERYGVEVASRILWEGLVVDSDISRESPKYSTGRPSQPAFQEMNFAALRKKDPNPVLFQYSDDDPFDSRMLIMAYEEEGRVVPVVSDFDCFLIGSRDFSFKDDMAEDQIELLDWCLSQIEWILDNQTEFPDSWTTKWLLVLKHAAQNGFVPKMPTFGFGDPSSCALIEAAVHRSKKKNGAVRHGPECFNYFFPQDLDSQLLIIFPGGQKWQYVSIPELQNILIDKIREGFTMPLNPKWILCDPGWMDVFVELLISQRPSVQQSMNMWYPPDSGLRERIINISKKHPEGFRSAGYSDANMSLAVQEYERFLVLQRARQKLRGYLFMRKLHATFVKKPEDSAEEKEKERVQGLADIVSEKNAPKVNRRTSMCRIENETMHSVRHAKYFALDDLEDDEEE